MGCDRVRRGRRARTVPLILTVITVSAAGAALLSCGGDSVKLPEQPVPVMEGPGVVDLPPPSALKLLSYDPAEFVRRGADYVADVGFPLQNAEALGDDCVFSPDWTPAESPPGSLAYACYAFDMTGFDRHHIITFSFEQAGDPADFWIGMSHFGRDHWVWYRLTGDNVLDISLTRHIDLETKTLLVLPLFTGTAPWQLSRVQVGDLCAVNGRVFYADGVTPMPGITIDLLGGEQYILATSDLTGTYYFDGAAPGDYTLRALDAWYEFTPPTLALELTADHVAEPFLATALRPLFAIDGYVYREDGTTPLPDVLVRINSRYPPYPMFEATTDAIGHYLAADVPAGMYWVKPWRMGYNFEPVDTNTVLIGSDLTLDDFVGSCPPSARMDGYVYELDGATPVPDVTVMVEGWYSFEAVTDSDGHWQLHEVFDNTYTVTPMLAPWTFDPPNRAVEVDGSDVNVEQFLGNELEAWLVDGHIYEVDSTIPVPDVEVFFDTMMNRYRSVTDAAGYYSIPLPDADWQVVPSSDCWNFDPPIQYTTVSGAPRKLEPFYAFAGG